MASRAFIRTTTKSSHLQCESSFIYRQTGAGPWILVQRGRTEHEEDKKTPSASRCPFARAMEGEGDFPRRLATELEARVADDL